MTLKQIRKDQVRKGMWIQEIKGFWFFHPFWDVDFLIQHPDDIEAIRRSWIKGVVIDTARGVDLVSAPSSLRDARANPAAAGKFSSARPRRASPLPRLSRRRLPPPLRCGMAAELGRARQVVRRARKIMAQLFAQARLGQVLSTEVLEPLVADLSASLSRNRSAIGSILRLKSKDEYTYMHSVAVAALMINLARELNLSEAEVREAGMAGLLHDVGKMAIDDDLLNKPGALTDAEFAVVREHPLRGHALLESSGDAPQGALDVSLHHHEKIDGTGYPKGLVGDEISLLARMGAVCDVYDALTSERPYKMAWSPAEAIAKMRAWEGHFDGQILCAFVRVMGAYPVGSLVRLISGRLAVVTDIASGDLAKVRIFADRHGTPIAMEDIDLDPAAATAAADAIACAEQPEACGFSDWEACWPKLVRAPKSRPFDARQPV